jgi:hypothetical protein
MLYMPSTVALAVLLGTLLVIPTCEAGALSVSISLSSYVANATNVSLTISFRVAAQSAAVPIKHVKIKNLAGSEERTMQGFDNSSCICTNLQSTRVEVDANVDFSHRHPAAIDGLPPVPATATFLPDFLGAPTPNGIVITFSDPATCAAPSFPVRCVLSFFGNCPHSTASAPGWVRFRV